MASGTARGTSVSPVLRALLYSVVEFRLDVNSTGIPGFSQFDGDGNFGEIILGVDPGMAARFVIAVCPSS